MKFNKINLLYVFLVLTIPVALQGCATPNEQLLGAEEQVKLRSMQSRAFDTTDKKKTLRTVIATMQDLGFVIGDADLEIGVVSGSKYADEHSAQMTVTVRVRNATQTLVRANVQQHLESVEDPAIYQDFYVALGKAMFLTAHNVD